MKESKEESSVSAQNPLQPVLELLQGKDPETVCSAYGISRDELQQRLEAYHASRRQMVYAEQVNARKAGRNDPCPCGSGRKFKKCCLPKYEDAKRNIPEAQFRELEVQAKARERLETDIKKGFDQLFAQDFQKAQMLGRHLLNSYPDDDRLHDILLTSLLALGDYGEALAICRDRWQVALEEREHFREKGHHKREGDDRKRLVHFYPPSTWLEKFWIAQRACVYQERYPAAPDSPLSSTASELMAANDPQRFPARREDGYQVRKEALKPALKRLEAAGTEALPYLLPLTYSFSWASLFVPDLLRSCSTDDCIRLLAELSMFRFPYFAQQCLANLEAFGERAVASIDAVLSDNPAFDELKGGLIKVLGNLALPASLVILKRLVEHENIYVIRWVVEALEQFDASQTHPYLQKARERLLKADSISGVFPDLEREIAS